MKTASYTYDRKPIRADVSGLRETEKDAYRKAGFYQETAIIDPASGRSIVIARFSGTGSTVYCDVWLTARRKSDSLVAMGNYGRGRGRAGGYGYHKASSALAAAFRDAGVVLSQDIGGVGDSAMGEACLVVAKALSGKRRLISHTAHG